MVTRYAVELDLPSKESAALLAKGIRAICADNPGWRLIGMGPVTSDPPCPKCGAPMVYSGDLQTYVCSHPE